MEWIIDRLLWIPKEDVDIEELKAQLTLTVPETPFAKERDVTFIKDAGKYWGVPRGLKIARVCKDNTAYHKIAFPKMRRKLRPGQVEALRQVKKKATFGGILQGKCGGGKSTAGIAIAEHFSTRTCILCHKGDLINQWEALIKEALPGCRYAIAKQSLPDVRGLHIVLGTYQTLNSRIEDFKASGFFRSFGLVICDECHNVPADTFHEALSQFTAKYRIGLTATPRRKDGLQDLLYLTLGERLCVMQGETLDGEYFEITWPSPYEGEDFYIRRGPKKFTNKAKLLGALVKDKKRTEFIARQIIKAVEAGRRPLVLSDRREQLDDLEKLLESESFTVRQFVGGISKKKEEEAREAQALLGTYQKIGEGTDIPSLDTIILATPRADIEQTVGRIQRPHEDKKTPFVVDIIDTIDVCRRSAKTRKKQLHQLGFKAKVKK